MPDKKLTDKEIVKAWECCKSDTALCNECPYDKIGECIEKMCADSIDLINRQQAELERLKEEKDEYAYLYNKHINTAFSHIKAEAYKECIGKVKDELRNIAKIEWQDNYYYLVGTAFFDNLIKEIIGE